MAEDYRYVRFCAWTGMIFMGVFILFWGNMGGNLPPWNADLPVSVIADWFREERNIIRTGMVISMTFTVCYASWGLAIGKVMRQACGPNSLLVDLQIWGAGLTVVPVLVSSSFWLTGAYRPDALPDEILQLLYDMAWLLIDLAYSVTSVQMIAFGMGFLQDKRETPLVPKWVCWYSIWVAFMFIAECLMPFFKSGPFARDGILNFWIEFLIFFLYAPIVTYYILKAVPRLEREAAQVAHAG